MAESKGKPSKAGKTSKSRLILYIVGPAVVGIAVLLIVLFALIAGGAVDATQTKLVFASASEEFVYDGTAHTDTEWTLVDGELREGHRADVVVSGSLTDVGSAENSFSVTIKDENGADVTDYYEIEYQPGTLTVEKASLFLSSATAEKVYDGLPFTAESYTVLSGTLADGHTIEATYGAGILNAGSVLNEFAVRIFDAEGEDKTYNYDLQLTAGVLTVTRRPLTLRSGSDEKVYDGEELTKKTCELTEGELVEGHELSYEVTGSRTDAGESENTFTATVLDANGTDIGENYELTLEKGTLTITPRPITVRSESDKKVYDGAALAREEITAASWSQLVEGHAIVADFTGSRTDAGSSDNTFTAVIRAEDGEGADVTKNYDVTIEYGTLTVEKRPITVTAADGNKPYDGQPLVIEGEPFKVTSTEDPPLVEGHTIEVTIEGYASADVYENKPNRITDVRITEEDAQTGELTDVTGNYAIDRVNGTLTITQREIKVESGKDGKVYDGKPLTKDGVTYDPEQLVEGHKLSYEMTGSQTDVGSSDNTFIVAVFDQNNNDVSGNYEIKMLTGTLTVTPRVLTLRSGEGTKPYDGKALTNNTVSESVGTLAEGQRVDAVVTGSQTDAGSSDNTFTAVIRDADGADVTSNYTLTCEYGTLTVKPRSLSILTSTRNFDYNGRAQGGETHDEKSGAAYWQCSENTPLLQGHRVAAIEMPQTVTDVIRSYPEGDSGAEGTVTGLPNYVSYIRIEDGAGRDVTANYAIEYYEGLLIVNPRQITVHSLGASKPYDGDPLTRNEYEFSSFLLPLSGHKEHVTITGSRTEVGESPNTIADVTITEGENGRSVTHNYKIQKVEDPLIVTEATGSGSGSGGSGSGGSGGEIPGGSSGLDTSGSISGGGNGSGTPSLALSLYSAQSGKVYLRLLSHGNYTGSGWDPASDYQGLLDRTYSMNYLTGAALASAGYQKTFLSLKVYCSDYYIPYYPAMGEAENYTVQTSDVWYKSGNEKIYNAYSLYSYLYDAVSDEAIEAGLGAYASVEEEYHAYVNKMYLATSGMSEELQTYFTSEIAEKGLKEGDIWQQIRSVAAYIQDAAEYNLDYNTALDDKADVIYAFLTEYKQGVCRHYASAATMLFRMLGIPARYTQGYVADAVANEWVDVMSTNAHAWVEVYIGGIGWVQVEVTGGGPGFGGGGGQGGEEGGGEQGGGEQGGGEGGEGGEQGGGEGGGGEGEGEGPGGGEQGGEQKEKLTVRPVDEYLQVNTVDATVSLKHTGTLQGLYDLEKKGYRYEVTVAGEQTKVGIGDCTIVESSFRLFDAAGKDVTDEYDITFQTGTLQVYVEELTVKTGEKSGVYNGLPLTDARCEVTGLLAGHTCTAKATGSITNVGSTPNTAEVTVEDAGGNDVTYMYRIINDYGTLTVTPRAITVQADSATKTFDPNNRTPLTAPDAEITAGSLADGHKATFTTKGSQTNVGYSENIVSEVKIVDENGNDVTANYKITKLPGTLTVTPPNQ